MEATFTAAVVDQLPAILGTSRTSRPLHLPLLLNTCFSPLRPVRRGACSPLLCSPSPSGFNGWEDDLDADPPHPLRHLLGVANAKDAFVFFLGFACALAISRVRLTLVSMLPVSVLAFAAGFTARALDASRSSVHRRSGGFPSLLESLDAKFSELEDAIGRGDTGRCLEAAEAVRLAAREAAGDCAERRPDRKARRKDASFFDLTRVITGLIRESPPPPTRSRDGAMRGNADVSSKNEQTDSLLQAPIIGGGEDRGESPTAMKAKDATLSTHASGMLPFEEERETLLFINGGKKGIGRMVLEQNKMQNVYTPLKDDGSWRPTSGSREDNDYSGHCISNDNRFESNLQSHDKWSSVPVSSNEEFIQNVKEAEDLLKQAKEHLRNNEDQEEVETRLYRSAELLSSAVALEPGSLVAVGQLGNTFLLHGELKLKISRDLRSLLSRNSLLITGKGGRLQSRGLNKQSLSREKVASVLIDVCEECEELLVKAGKSYRVALSIDGNDIRALYNWGLALTFRAQLIGDIGPEAAFDADKIYLAAIDKFSALTSRSHTFTPDALFRWGLALQQRSQLRSFDSREKIKLLKQAKSLFEDVLCSDTDNPVVREALFSCISELNYYRQLK